jgi:hypothetical protein
MNLEAVMKKIALLSAVVLVATIASTNAYALSNRTFVSGNGSDSNPCSIVAPCRSFAGAIAQTSAGGEIAVLDTAGYGAVTITQAVSIINEEGVEAGISVTSGDGITINAGASDVVNLRGLTLVGVGGTNGITLTRSAALNIQNCVIRGFTSKGLNLTPTAKADINVSNTIVSDNGAGNGADGGIFLRPVGNNITITASFEQVQAIHTNGFGFAVLGSGITSGGSVNATAANSLASGGIIGFSVGSETGKPPSIFTLVNSKATYNQEGVATGPNATIFLNASTVSGNSLSGFDVGGGTISSFGNNAIIDTNNNGSLTSVALR